MTETTIVVDRFAFVETLLSRGFTRDQAEGLVEAVSEIALAQLVSKQDLRDAVADIRVGHLNLRNDLLKFMFGAMAAQTALIVALIELLK